MLRFNVYKGHWNIISRRCGTYSGSVSEKAACSDEENQEALVEWLERQEYWKRNKGRDQVIVASDPNAMSDFGRLRPDQGSLVKDVIVPYSHRIRTYDGDVGVDSRNTLLFFMGNRYRKEGGKIRDLLFQILEKEQDLIIKHGAQSRESRRAASTGNAYVKVLFTSCRRHSISLPTV